MHVVELSIGGNDKQETREGYNVLDILGLSLQNQDKGVTIDRSEDGYITANGTSTQSYSVYLKDNDLSSKLEDGETYSIWQENYSKTNNGGVYLQVIAKPIGGGADVFITASMQKNTFTVDKSKYTYQSSIQIGSIETAGTFNNYKNRYMIYKGTDNKEFELYGAMPSPSYPSEVECVGDNVNIFDKDNVNKIDGYINGGNKTIYTDMEGTKILYIECEGNTAYTVSKKLSARFVVGSIATIPAANGICSKIENNANAKSITITTDKNDTYLCVYYYSASVDTLTEQEILDSIKIEKGKVTSAYSSYNMGCASVVVGDKNVFSFEKAEKLATYAMPSYEVIDNNSIELKNSADWAYIQYQYILKKNTQYTISYDLEFEGAENVAQWWTTIEDSLGSIATDFVTLVNNKYIKTFTTREDMIVKIKLFASTPINPALTIIKNIQIEEGNTATEYIPHLEQTKVVDIQQEMLEGDYFVKEVDGWKEVHGWNKRVLDGSEYWILNTTYASVFYTDASYNIFSDIESDSNKYKLLCNIYKYNGLVSSSANITNNNIYGFKENEAKVYKRINLKDTRFTTLEEFKNWLQQKNTEGNPVYLWYKLATPTKLTCTEKQSTQLDDLLNTSTYKNVTHIYSTDKVSPIIKIKYRKDIETMFNTQQSEYETRLSNIEKLLSTTTTSALLLDNLQTDLEKEVI